MINLHTLEGHEVCMAEVDHAKLSKWPGIDLGRLHVVGDEVYPEVRGKRHGMTLEAMLEVMTVPAIPAPPVPLAFPADPVLPTGAKVPGKPRAGGLLHDYLIGKPVKACPGVRSTGKPPPRVRNGDVLLASKDTLPRYQDGQVRVVVATQTGNPRDLLGYATLPDMVYGALVRSGVPHDRTMWSLGEDGRVQTRIKRDSREPYPQAIDDLLAELGIEAAVTFRPAA